MALLFDWELYIEDEIGEFYLTTVEQYFWCDGAELTYKISTPTIKLVRESEVMR